MLKLVRGWTNSIGPVAGLEVFLVLRRVELKIEREERVHEQAPLHPHEEEAKRYQTASGGFLVWIFI